MHDHDDPHCSDDEPGHGHDHAEHSHLDDTERRVRALQSVLVQKGLVDPAALDALIETYEHRIGPRNGAKVVAKAWVDADFKRWLLSDATSALTSLGYGGRQGEHMVVLENTPGQHHLVVCTLCSCYPWPVLGLPPTWYKSAPYRSRAVQDPVGVLAEFGVQLPAGTQLHVADSTAEVRYMVLPMRPQGTEGLSEVELSDWVTRDSMIGTGLPQAPQAVAHAIASRPVG